MSPFCSISRAAGTRLRQRPQRQLAQVAEQPFFPGGKLARLGGRNFSQRHEVFVDRGVQLVGRDIAVEGKNAQPLELDGRLGRAILGA